MATFLSRNQPPLNQADTRSRLRGLNAVVTGGASGIGRACAERLLNDGVAQLAVLDINEEAGLETVQDLIENEGVDKSRVHFYRVDVASNHDQLSETIASFAKEFCGGAVHLLVNSAVYFGSVGLNGSDEDFLKSFRVNVVGVINAVKSVHPFMRSLPDDTWGSIVNISSISAHCCQRERWSYAATKGAVDIVTKDMALDLAKDRIRVNSVSPGCIWSPEQAKVGTREAYRPLTSRVSFLGRDGETSEVGAVVAFLLSRDATFVNGTDIKVDGGYTAMGPEAKGEASIYAGHDD